MSTPRRIRAYLDLVGQDLEAAEVLAKAGNRYAAYHCQQAIEKLVKAHRLDVLMGRLGDTHAWRGELHPLGKYTPFATTFRYPTPGGRIAAAPDAATVLADVATVRGLLARAERELLSPPRP